MTAIHATETPQYRIHLRNCFSSADEALCFIIGSRFRNKVSVGRVRVNSSSVAELCVMSRALERALRALPNKPRSDIATSDLADGILAAAVDGIRDETILAKLALERVGIAADQLEAA